MPPQGPDQTPPTWQPPGPPVPAPSAPPAAVLNTSRARRVGLWVFAAAVLVYVVLDTLFYQVGGPSAAPGAARSSVHAAGSGGAASAPGAVPTVLATASLSVPPAPPAQSVAQAQASADAAGAVFKPPTSVPASVPAFSGSLTAADIPADLAVQLPGLKASDPAGQAAGNAAQAFLRVWVEAWAAGNTADARYAAWCVAQCRSVADPVISLWGKAGIRPAGTLRFYGLAGGTSKTNDQSAEVGVCLDESGIEAVTASGAAGANPYPQMAPTLYVFGLIYDPAVNHWVVTEGYWHTGDSYCDQGATG